MAHSRVGRWIGTCALALAGAAFATPGVAVEVAAGWRYQVHAGGIRSVDNIAFAPDGALYATSERSGGRGQLLRLHNGTREIVVDRLNRPDGLLLEGDTVYITEEVLDGRLLKLSRASGALRTLALLRSPEGIALASDGSLYVAEDQVSGRVVRVRTDGQVDVYIGGLNRPEGLCLDKNGVLYIAETATGRVLTYRAGEMHTLLEDLDEPDQLQLAPDGSLWITEDANPGRLLRLRDGALDVVASGLVNPQGIAFGADGLVFVAEQGRDRILVIVPADPAARTAPGGPTASVRRAN